VIEVPKVETHVVEKFVEVPEVRIVEKIIEVPRVAIEEKITEVPKPETRIVEKFVEVPEVRIVEKIVEVPEVYTTEVVRHIPKIEIHEVIRHVPKVDIQTVERIVEVPQVHYVDKVISVPVPDGPAPVFVAPPRAAIHAPGRLTCIGGTRAAGVQLAMSHALPVQVAPFPTEMQAQEGYRLIPPGQLAGAITPFQTVTLQGVSTVHSEFHSEFAVGDPVEVFSNSHQAWCIGQVEYLEGPMANIVFWLPNHERANKVVPLGHKSLRKRRLQAADVYQEGFADGFKKVQEIYQKAFLDGVRANLPNE
jgi:hypothetical protein